MELAQANEVILASTAHLPYAREVAIFLVVSVIVVPLFQRIGVSPILGFLLVGASVGPFGLGLTQNTDGVSALASLGIVFLMFTIGLELSFERLKAMRRLVFGLGGAQVAVSGLLIAIIAYLVRPELGPALVIGVALALSSTAMVLQLLAEKGQMTRRHGRTSLAVLLFQDLAVVPVLILLNVFNPETSSRFIPADLGVGAELTAALLTAIAAIAVIVIGGRFLVRRMFAIAAASKTPETFVAMTLLVVLGVAYATYTAGLSMELGAFLVGLLLSETEYRHQVESDIAPFKGLLLGLFFISVGMSLNIGLVMDWAVWVALGVTGLIVLKAGLIFGLCTLFDLPRAVSIRVGLLLSTGGEFAFVILQTATQSNVLGEDAGQYIVLVASLSMMAAPGLSWLADKVAERMAPRGQRLGPASSELEDLDGHIIIAGFGRVGQQVADMLEKRKIQYVALDLDATRIWTLRTRSKPAYFGDAGRPQVLLKIGAARAAAALITIDSRAEALRAVEAFKMVKHDLPIIARAVDNSHARMLRGRGASSVVLETLEASLQLGGLVLRSLGTSRDAVGGLIERTRAEHYEGVGHWLPIRGGLKTDESEDYTAQASGEEDDAPRGA